MKSSQPFLLPIWVIGAVIMLRIFIFIVFLSYLGDFQPEDDLPFFEIFLAILWPVVLIIEFVLYWIMRYRIYNRSWVHIHVWTVLLCIGIFPILIVLVRKLFPMTVDNMFEQDATYATIVQWQIYLFWLLLGAGHVFFIGTIVKSFSKKQETISDEQATGLLDEFAE